MKWLFLFLGFPVMLILMVVLVILIVMKCVPEQNQL